VKWGLIVFALLVLFSLIALVIGLLFGKVEHLLVRQ
jgi:hypothetical protein